MFTQDQIIAKVRKLINLAQNAGATEGERDNAMSMAHKFLAKHNLSMAEIGSEKIEDDRNDIILEFRNIPAYRRIAHAIAKLYFCNYVYFKGSNRHLMVGKEANVISATEMTMFVITAIAKGARKYAQEHGGVSSLKTAYRHGAADTIYWKVEDIIKASKDQKPEGSTGTALVLADVYTAEAERNRKFLEELYGKTAPGKSRKRQPMNSDAYYKGVAKGKSVNLNSQLASG